MNQSDISAYWEAEVCGTRFATATSTLEQSQEISAARYLAEPFIRDFARFDSRPGDNVLEVGVGAGTDFMEWLNTGAHCYGIDATTAAIELTRSRITVEEVSPPVQLFVADAADLPFAMDFFDYVYSYGVIHHAERTTDCLAEIHRVLRAGGTARVMVYSSFSATGLMLYLMYGLARLRPFTSQRAVVSQHLESPGTKCYSKGEFRRMAEAAGFTVGSIIKKAGSGDLLLMPPSQKYARQGGLYRLVQRVYPRALVRRSESLLGLFLLVEMTKPLTLPGRVNSHLHTQG